MLPVSPVPSHLPTRGRIRPGRRGRPVVATARDLERPERPERPAFVGAELDAWVDQNCRRPVLKYRGRKTLEDCEPEPVELVGEWRVVRGIRVLSS